MMVCMQCDSVHDTMVEGQLPPHRDSDLGLPSTYILDERNKVSGFATGAGSVSGGESFWFPRGAWEPGKHRDATTVAVFVWLPRRAWEPGKASRCWRSGCFSYVRVPHLPSSPPSLYTRSALSAVPLAAISAFIVLTCYPRTAYPSVCCRHAVCSGAGGRGQGRNLCLPNLKDSTPGCSANSVEWSEKRPVSGSFQY